MSISTFNKILQNQGCVWAVSALTLAGVIGGAMYQGCAADPHQHAPEQTNKQSEVIAKVGDYTITETSLNAQIQQQMGGSIDFTRLPPSIYIQFAGQALANEVSKGQLAAIGRQQGLKPSDDDVVQTYMRAFDPKMEQIRQQLITQKKLKPNATQADFDAEVKKATGKTIAQLRQEQEKELRDNLKNPATRENVLANVYYPGAILDAMKKSITVSDEDLKKSFDKYEFKRVFVSNGTKGGATANQDPMAQATKIAAEIKGGLPFEKAIDRYSTDTPPAKKKNSENIIPMTVSEMTMIPDYKPLLALKEGQVSDPIKMGNGAAIYKLVDIKHNMPKDFDKQKLALRDTYAQDQARALVQKQLMTAPQITWENKGYEALYEANKLQTDPVDDATRRKKTLDLIGLAEEAAGDQDPTKGRFAASVALNLYKGLEASSTPEQKKELYDKGIEVYNLFFQKDEDPLGRTDLAQIYIEKGQGPEAVAALEAAAQNNQFNTDDKGQSAYNAINSKIKTLRDKKLATDEQLKHLEDLQTAWVTQKKADDKVRDDQKKAEEEQKKKDDAAAKAAKANAPAPGPVVPGKTNPGAPLPGVPNLGGSTSKPKGK